MKIHHVCIIVSDMDESLKLYADVLGFKVIRDIVIPDNGLFDQKTLDDIFQVKSAKSRMAILVSADGTMLELQQPMCPKIQKVPKEVLHYGYVGISELAFQVTHIDEWLEKIKSSGYETQTSTIWKAGNILRSFLFYDPDGAMLQFIEEIHS